MNQELGTGEGAGLEGAAWVRRGARGRRRRHSRGRDLSGGAVSAKPTTQSKLLSWSVECHARTLARAVTMGSPVGETSVVASSMRR